MDETDKKEANAQGARVVELRAAALATAFASAMNAMALLAAPRVLARAVVEAKGRSVREKIAQTIEAAVRALGSGAGEAQIVEPLRALQALLPSWKPGKPAPQAVVEAARAWLRLVGLPPPEEGWDKWEGGSDEPDARPARPTPRVLRAEPMTVDEWLHQEDPGELVGGLFIEEEATSPLHDAVVGWLLEALRAWASSRGALVSGPGHKLVVSALGGRKPDISVYTTDDLPEGDEDLSRRPPTLVVEVMSPRRVDGYTDHVIKLDEYARLGVKWYWLIEPNQRIFECMELGPDARYTMFLGAVDGGQLRALGLAGLALDLDDLWAKIAPITHGAQGETP
jgi:Uma2 family endonuclease